MNKASARILRELPGGLRYAPRVVLTDKLASCSAPCTEFLPNTVHRLDEGANNRAENSHQSKRERDRRMQDSKSAWHAQ